MQNSHRNLQAHLKTAHANEQTKEMKDWVKWKMKLERLFA